MIFAPFILALLGLACGPFIWRATWHKIEKIFFIALTVIGAISVYQYFGNQGITMIYDTLCHEYVPFILLMSSLFMMSHGIHIDIQCQASPIHNTCLLLVGSVIASLVGTSGAALLLIRPFIRMNEFRQNKTHLIIFFIFTVCNMGGCLTPLGDPPLFLGFLKGIPFVWPVKNLWYPFLLTLGLTLMVFYGIDHIFYKKHPPLIAHTDRLSIKIKGSELIIVLMAIMASSFMSNRTIYTLTLLCFVCGSTIYVRFFKKEHFSLLPLYELIRVFLCIFITLIPVTHSDWHSLKPYLSECGQLSASKFFWMCGGLSAVLDNAPTYLLFLDFAGGVDEIQKTPHILTAISLGSVFMGAMTYIGNAPNFMVNSIAKSFHIPMPSFLKYMGWSFAILLPIFMILRMVIF